MIDTLVMTIPLITKHGYLGLFEVVKDLGKILVVVIFMFVKYPLCSTCASILFPTAMLCSFMCRQATSLRLRDQACKAELDSEALATDAARGLTIIDNFGMKDYTVARYQECLKGQRSLTMEVKMFNFWSDQTVPWLSSIAITVYMIYGSFQVLEGAETVGSFVATLNVLKDLGDRFEVVYAGLAGARDTVKPLLTLVRFMNLPTDLPDKKLISDSCLTFATEKFQSSAVHNWDQVPILFSGVCFEHLPRCRNVDFSFSSGGIVLVHGPQGTGKKHVLKAFACGEKLRHGDVLMAPYQVTCFVDFDPVLLSWLSLLDNLRFGATEENGHPERIRQIFKRVGIQPDHWLMAHLEKDIEGGNEGWNKEESPWFIRASRCERKMIHMARAFVFDPHILVMHNVIDDLDKDHSSSILDMLTDFVNEGHVSMLMRTVVLSTGSSDIAEALWGWSDYQLDLRSIPLCITSASTSNGVRTHAHRHVSLLKYPYGALAECPRKAASDPMRFLI
jgi:ABC-type multidrug transport system fused ATPase/permease subunit